VRIFLSTALFFAFAWQSQAQIKAASDVGIDEKLGARVAMNTILKDENGNDMTLRQYVDKPTILMFNYLRCPGRKTTRGLLPRSLGPLILNAPKSAASAMRPCLQKRS
jgi:hypothetical protein